MRAKGFTLIELMIVVTVIAIVAAIALPNLLSSRLASNETAAMATLRALTSAQIQFQAAAAADEDFDGFGEYGTFGEMTAKIGVRGGAFVRPPQLSSAFRSINAQGAVPRDGYLFRIYLPGAGGTGLGEVAGGGAPAGIDPDLAETTWCAYAWPTSFNYSGTKTFFVNQGGDIIFAIDPSYDGPLSGPPAGAAFSGSGPATSITAIVATGTVGRDGNDWRRVDR